MEEQPISIKSCLVDIANNYTKRRHVFRLTTFNGSEYLFQADSHEEMLRWIEAVQENNNPDQDVRVGQVSGYKACLCSCGVYGDTYICGMTTL